MLNKLTIVLYRGYKSFNAFVQLVKCQKTVLFYNCYLVRVFAFLQLIMLTCFNLNLTFLSLLSYFIFVYSIKLILKTP